jgi:hypothetical protein
MVVVRRISFECEGRLRPTSRSVFAHNGDGTDLRRDLGSVAFVIPWVLTAVDLQIPSLVAELLTYYWQFIECFLHFSASCIRHLPLIPLSPYLLMNT